MRISIFGLGYVGSVTGACLADLGHTIVGVDANPDKVALINQAQSPIVEEGLDDLLARTVASGKFAATNSAAEAIAATDVAFICVGTPSLSNGNIDLRFVRRVAEEIGSAIGIKASYFTVVIRSTVLPGSVENVIIPILEQHSGRQAGRDFGVCMNPEFLREGSAIRDFHGPPVTVIGQLDERAGESLCQLYAELKAEIRRVPLRVAEVVKYSANAFHALKIVFANEVGSICKALNVDSHQVMDIFCCDRKLNISDAYLKPGFAFGGSCLPKDLRALGYEAHSLDVETPMFDSLLESNQRQIARVVNKLRTYKGRRLGFFGLSFKGGTDDLRESPIVELVEAMLGKGFEVRIYDRYVSLGKLVGANKAYIEREIPHLGSILVDSADELLRKSDVLVVGYKDDEVRAAMSKVGEQHAVIDLVRPLPGGVPTAGEYYGICW